MADEHDPNHALLVGEIAGLLSTRLEVELEIGETSDYTGRVLIRRPSGWWAVTVECIQKADHA